MSLTISTNVYKVEELTKAIIDTAVNNKDLANEQFIIKALAEFGVIINNVFIVTWNEYAEEGNPAINCMCFFEAIFGVDKPFWKCQLESPVSWTDKEEIATNLDVAAQYEEGDRKINS